MCLTLFSALILLLTVGSRSERFELSAEREAVLLLFTPKLTQLQDITHFAVLNPLELWNWEHSRLWPCLSSRSNLSPTWVSKWRDCQKSAGCFLCFIVVAISALIHFSGCCVLLGYFRILLALWSYIVGFYFVLGNSAAEGPILTKSSCY